MTILGILFGVIATFAMTVVIIVGVNIQKPYKKDPSERIK